MSLYYANVKTLHYAVTMLGQYDYIPLHYAKAVMLHYAIVIMLLYM